MTMGAAVQPVFWHHPRANHSLPFISSLFLNEMRERRCSVQHIHTTPPHNKPLVVVLRFCPAPHTSHSSVVTPTLLGSDSHSVSLLGACFVFCSFRGMYGCVFRICCRRWQRRHFFICLLSEVKVDTRWTCSTSLFFTPANLFDLWHRTNWNHALCLSNEIIWLSAEWLQMYSRALPHPFNLISWIGCSPSCSPAHPCKSARKIVVRVSVLHYISVLVHNALLPFSYSSTVWVHKSISRRNIRVLPLVRLLPFHHRPPTNTVSPPTSRTALHRESWVNVKRKVWSCEIWHKGRFA